MHIVGIRIKCSMVKVSFAYLLPVSLSSLKIAFLSLSIDLVLANSEDTDEMPHYATDLAGKLN